MLYLNTCDIVIITVKGVDYCCIIHEISKSEVIQFLENSVLEDRGCRKKCLSLLRIESTTTLIN